MCDIWQSSDVQQLTETDVRALLASLEALRTEWVVISGGEALMNPNLFRLCRLIRAEGMKVTLLSTGLLLKRYTAEIVADVDELIVSLDGSEAVHNAIRRIPTAFQKLCEGISAVKAAKPRFPISARCVIQRLNFMDWPNIVETARDIGLDQISFLPADVSTEAFNRPNLWTEDRAAEVKLDVDQLPHLKAVIEALIRDYSADFTAGFIAEPPPKIRRIYDYYAALQGLSDFPPVRCNAPWVSAVVEADGSVRPCFFHASIGNIRQTSLLTILNDQRVIEFRRNLDMGTDPICRKCVCSLNLRPMTKMK